MNTSLPLQSGSDIRSNTTTRSNQPFAGIAWIMKEPLFGGRFVDVYPPGFEHVVASK